MGNPLLGITCCLFVYKIFQIMEMHFVYSSYYKSNEQTDVKIDFSICIIFL